MLAECFRPPLMMIFSFCNFILVDSLFFFFFNDTATTEIYTLSLHDALPIWCRCRPDRRGRRRGVVPLLRPRARPKKRRSEEHTSELQSQSNLVCRLLLEKKKQNKDLANFLAAYRNEHQPYAFRFDP